MTIHGDSESRLFRIWTGMKHRCNSPRYEHYFGRGIRVCEQWKSSFIPFREWAHANGYAGNLSIDRIDNDRGYEPSNCRWVEMSEQAKNRRFNLSVTAFGETKTAAEWARDSRAAVKAPTIRSRLTKGWSPERAISEPALAAKPRSTVSCACGCGATFLNPDDHGRNRRFLSGHHMRQLFTFTTLD